MGETASSMFSEEESGIKSNRYNSKMKIICHGGAGHTPKVQDGVDKAAEKGWKVLTETDNALEAAIASVIVMEDDFRFNAGTGSCLRSDGSVQNDAAVAISSGEMGAITNLQDFKNPVLVAKELLNEFVVMLAGEGAIDFALTKGFTRSKVIGSEKGWTGDTVGAVAQSSSGDIAVASSTGGVSGRPVGRVGDTPLWGSGFYCDKNIGILATGVGEAITEQLMCYRVYQYSQNIEEAMNWGVKLLPKDVGVGIIGIHSNGQIYGTSNTTMPFAIIQD
jgi:beta-aspartyl-peptidase (threonine type)